MPLPSCDARTFLLRKSHSRQHPLAIARVAGGVKAQATSIIQLGPGNCCVELALPARTRRARQGQPGEQWAGAGVGMDLELASRAGLGAHNGSLSLVPEAPRYAADRQRDVFNALQPRGTPQPTHVADIHLVD